MNYKEFYKYSSYVYRNERHKWLFQHGGRVESDVLTDQDGEYVVMTDGQQDVKVRLPANCHKEVIKKLGDGVIHNYLNLKDGNIPV